MDKSRSFILLLIVNNNSSGLLQVMGLLVIFVKLDTYCFCDCFCFMSTQPQPTSLIYPTRFHESVYSTVLTQDDTPSSHIYKQESQETPALSLSTRDTYVWGQKYRDRKQSKTGHMRVLKNFLGYKFLGCDFAHVHGLKTSTPLPTQ